MEEENKNIAVENIIDDSKNDITPEEFLDEKSDKNKSGIFIIIGILVLLIVGVLLFKFLIDKPVDKGEIDNTKNDNISNVTISDDVTQSDDIIFNDRYVVENEVSLDNEYDNIDAITYKCKTKECAIITVNDGILVYDNQTFIFKKYSNVEYDKLFLKDVDLMEPIILYYDDFEEVELEKYLDLDEIDGKKRYIYKYNGEYLVYPSYFNDDIDKLFKEDGYYCADCSQVEDDLVIYENYIIDLKNKKVVYNSESCFYINIFKEGSFYIGALDECESGSHVITIIDKGYKFIDDTFWERISINDDILYHLNQNKLYTFNSNGELLGEEVVEDAVSISHSKLLCFDADDNLIIKDIVTNEVIVNYGDINIADYNLSLFFEFDKYNGDIYEVSIIGDFLLDDNDFPIDIDSNFKNFITDNNLGSIDYKKIIDEAAEYMDSIIYLLKFDKDGNYVSGELITSNY